MADRARSGLDGRLALGGLLIAGLAAIVLASVAGFAEGALHALASPPPIVRAGLSGVAIVLGARLLLGAIGRIDRSIRGETDLGTMVRGVRLVFLAAAAFTAAGGWVLGEPLPLVIALVIGGVDVVETSFLLLVASRRES
jgi:hypothetical protein